MFDEEALAELEHSIREFGLLQPVVVREAGPGRYQLVMGERRWRAAQRAGLQRIPAIVRRHRRRRLLRDALLENIHRVQLNPLEEAAAYEQLLVEFGVTHERAGRPARPQPPGRHEHDPAAEAAGDRAAPGRRRRAVGRARPGAARTGGRRAGRRTSRRGSWPRGCRCGPPRKRCCWRGRGARRPAPAAAEADRRPGTHDLAERLSRHVRHPGPGGDGAAQGPDRRRVRLGRGPRADRHDHGRRERLTADDRQGCVPRGTRPRCFTGTSVGFMWTRSGRCAPEESTARASTSRRRLQDARFTWNIEAIGRGRVRRNVR